MHIIIPLNIGFVFTAKSTTRTINLNRHHGSYRNLSTEAVSERLSPIFEEETANRSYIMEEPRPQLDEKTI